MIGRTPVPIQERIDNAQENRIVVEALPLTLGEPEVEVEKSNEDAEVSNLLDLSVAEKEIETVTITLVKQESSMKLGQRKALGHLTNSPSRSNATSPSKFSSPSRSKMSNPGERRVSLNFARPLRA
jgi:hypothetical protein